MEVAVNRERLLLARENRKIDKALVMFYGRTPHNVENRLEAAERWRQFNK